MIHEAHTIALAGLTLGLTSSVHCTAMCGPIALAGRAYGGPRASVPYFAGRIVAYVSVGALAGGVGRALLSTAWATGIEQLMTYVLAATLIWSAWRALAPSMAKAPIQLGKGPRRPGLSRHLVRVAREPLLLGAATALLPCATLYGAVAAAGATGTALHGAVLMFVFATVTGLAVVGFGQLAALRLEARWWRGALAVALVAGAIVLLARPASGAPVGTRASCPLHAQP